MSETEIFLSYSREDRAAARHIAESFVEEGFTVWWDAALRSGQTFDEVIEKELRSAKAVVVLWSPRSVASRWVRAEATLADRRDKLVPAIIEACDRPIIFELTHAADLSDWTGDTSDSRWRTLVSDLRRLVEKDTHDAPAQAAVAEPVASPKPAFRASAGPLASERNTIDAEALPPTADEPKFAPLRLSNIRGSELLKPAHLEDEQTQFYKNSDGHHPAESATVHCLQRLDGEQSETRFVVGPSGVRIGRTPPADIIVPGSGVSRAHCLVELVGDQLLVSDLNSTNGTYIDNKRVGRAVPLAVGSVLRVGNVSFEHEVRSGGGMELPSDPLHFHPGANRSETRLAKSS